MQTVGHFEGYRVGGVGAGARAVVNHPFVVLRGVENARRVVLVGAHHIGRGTALGGGRVGSVVNPAVFVGRVFALGNHTAQGVEQSTHLTYLVGADAMAFELAEGYHGEGILAIEAALFGEAEGLIVVNRGYHHGVGR